jgi:hypothetical protein
MWSWLYRGTVQDMLGGTGKFTKISQSWHIFGPTEIRSQRLLNTSADRHRHDNLLGDQLVTRGYIQFR